MPLLHMIGTIASITGAITIVAPVRHNGSSIIDKFKKGGSRRLPPFANVLYRHRSALSARMFRERRAPRERCVQFWFGSKPGGVMSPPELSAPIYSLAA
jgi:hypothetical protein